MPGALLGMRGLLLCGEQLCHPSGLQSLMGMLLVSCLCPPSPGLCGPHGRQAGWGQGEICACPEGHCVEHGVVGDTGNDTTSLLCPCLSLFPFWVWGLGIVRRSLFSHQSALLHLTCSLPLSPIIVCPPWLGACDR